MQEKDFTLIEKRMVKYRMILNTMFVLNIIILINIIHSLLSKL